MVEQNSQDSKFSRFHLDQDEAGTEVFFHVTSAAQFFNVECLEAVHNLM